MDDDDRIKYAMELAEKCWNKALHRAPSFVERYFECAEELLLERPLVMGDEFREYCARNLLFLPNNLHHNTWVSGVTALKEIGWIRPVGKSEPSKSHNHMDLVTMWRSEIYGRKKINGNKINIQGRLF